MGRRARQRARERPCFRSRHAHARPSRRQAAGLVRWRRPARQAPQEREAKGGRGGDTLLQELHAEEEVGLSGEGGAGTEGRGEGRAGGPQKRVRVAPRVCGAAVEQSTPSGGWIRTRSNVFSPSSGGMTPVCTTTCVRPLASGGVCVRPHGGGRGKGEGGEGRGERGFHPLGYHSSPDVAAALGEASTHQGTDASRRPLSVGGRRGLVAPLHSATRPSSHVDSRREDIF